MHGETLKIKKNTHFVKRSTVMQAQRSTSIQGVSKEMLGYLM